MVKLTFTGSAFSDVKLYESGTISIDISHQLVVTYITYYLKML